MLRAFCTLALAAVCGAAAPAAQRHAAKQPPVADVGDTLDRVGARVIEWYARAQSIVSQETVHITPLRPDLSADGFPRRLGYELSVAWDPGGIGPGALPEPSVLRELLTVNGRPPRGRDEPGCMDPKPVTPEPLMMLLPEEREAFAFTHAGTTRVDGRLALMLDYKGVNRGTPDVRFTKECVSVSLPGRSRGRIWIDAATYDVMRLDEHLVGMFDFSVPREHQRRGAATSMTIERADSSIRYQRVSFDDPPETLMLPVAVDTVTVIRGGAIQRTRISQRYSGFKRFIGDARVVE
jgi:hypothetical protein